MKTFRNRLIAAGLVVLVMTTGCKSVFLPSKRLDMGPFGDNTMAMLQEVQRNLLSKRPLYIKPYLNQGADFAEFRSQWDDMQSTLRSIGLYSTQVVSLSRSNLAEAKKAGLLAQYAEALMTSLNGRKDFETQLPQPDLDASLAAIRTKETLLAALYSAQPLVDTTERYCNSAFDRMNGLLQRLTQETQDRIDSNSALILESSGYLKSLQGRSMKSYTLLFEYRMGTPQALDALLNNDQMLRPYVKRENPADTRSLDLMEKDIMTRLQNIAQMTDQLRPQLDLYRTETAELDEYARANEETIRKARIAVQTWARLHGNLAAGIAVQPAVNITDILSGAATNAAKKALTVR